MTNHDEEKGLHRTPTGVTMSPELFEKVKQPPLPLVVNAFLKLEYLGIKY